jgi:hypothetical protein
MADQPQRQINATDGNVQNVPQLPEPQVPVVKDEEQNTEGESGITQMNQPDVVGDDEGDKEYNAIEEAQQAVEFRSTPGDIWKHTLEGMEGLKVVVSPISEVCYQYAFILVS